MCLFTFSDTVNILPCTKEYIAFWKVPRLRLFVLLVTIDAATEVGSHTSYGVDVMRPALTLNPSIGLLC